MILLPGDARYKHIIDRPGHITSLVEAHHRGHTDAVASEIPLPLGMFAKVVGPTASRRGTSQRDPARSLADRGDSWRSFLMP